MPDEYYINPYQNNININSRININPANTSVNSPSTANLNNQYEQDQFIMQNNIYSKPTFKESMEQFLNRIRNLSSLRNINDRVSKNFDEDEFVHKTSHADTIKQQADTAFHYNDWLTAKSNTSLSKISDDIKQVKQAYSGAVTNISNASNTVSNLGDKIAQNVEKYDKTVSKDNTSILQSNTNMHEHNFNALEESVKIIPGARRISPIEENAKDDNPVKAVGLGTVALINAREDARDLMSIFGRTHSDAPEGYFARFKFFAGTSMENWLRKSKIGQFILDKVDKSIDDTKLADKLYKSIGIEKDVDKFDKEVKWPWGKETVTREYVKFEGAFWKKLTGLTFSRITKIGLAVAALLEIPSICEAIKEKDSKQVLKSGLNTTVPITLGALTSSLLAITLAPFGVLGAAGSVLGLGLGIYLGGKLVNLIKKDK